MDEQLVMQEDLQRLRIGLGSDVFMVCRTGQTGRGTRRNLCGLRFGNISLLPQDEEKFYLVEMRSVSGHSGSPVCVYDTPTVFGDQKDKQWQFAPLLIGLNRGHQTTYEKVRRITEGDFEQLRDLVAETNTAIASVVPAWHIRELLNCKKFVNQRFRRDAKRTPWDYFVPDVPKIPTGKKLMLRANGVAQLEDITLEDRKKAKALKKIARSGFKQSVPQKSPRRR